MKTTILFAGKYGSTEYIAKMIKSKLGEDAVVINLRDNKKPDISSADCVVIGSGVYMGRAGREVRNFCKNRVNELRNKKVALYLCCTENKEEEVEKYFQKTFPEAVLSSAFAHRRFPGALVRSEKEGAMVRSMFEQMTKTNADRKEPVEQWVTAFVDAIKR
mgnify:FL=1